MSRDWTPAEHYLVEQKHIKEGRGDIFDFLENLKIVYDNGQEQIVHSVEEMATRRQFPMLGRLLMDEFMELYEHLSVMPGGVDFLHHKDEELADLVKAIESRSSEVDKDSYLFKWFVGKLDEHFYYGERNNRLLLDAICREALEKGLCNWVITDPDCLQVRRQVGFDDRGIFQLMQVDACGAVSEDAPVYQLAWAEIDLEDYSQKEIDSALDSYGYDSFKGLLVAAGSPKEAYGQLAEMFFENEVADCYVQRFTSWNEALGEIERRTGLSLDANREVESISISGEEMEALGNRGAARLRQQAKEDFKALDVQIADCSVRVVERDSECGAVDKDR